MPQQEVLHLLAVKMNGPVNGLIFQKQLMEVRLFIRLKKQQLYLSILRVRRTLETERHLQEYIIQNHMLQSLQIHMRSKKVL